MSAAPFSLNEDLRRLRDDGYFVQIVGGFLVMREVPYVNAQQEVKMGTLISSLCMSGNITQKPEPHTIHFDGDFPCTSQGAPILAIAHTSGAVDLGHGLIAQHMFSSKPGAEGYRDYHQKMTTYATIVSGHAAILKPGITPRVYKQPDEEENSVFNYVETASDRAGIGALTGRLEGQCVLILGVGGTGSYVLDQVAKTPVREIRLIDGDDFLQHNAFRVPRSARRVHRHSTPCATCRRRWTTSLASTETCTATSCRMQSRWTRAIWTYWTGSPSLFFAWTRVSPNAWRYKSWRKWVCSSWTWEWVSSSLMVRWVASCE